MAFFKTKQFNIISYILQQASEIDDIDSKSIDDIVNMFVIRFASDNTIFNERLFRKGCGHHINQRCIIQDLDMNAIRNKLRRQN